MSEARPLACADCGTSNPTRFRVDDRQRRISGVPFGSPYDFGLCLQCAKKVDHRMEERRRVERLRHERAIAEARRP